MAIFKYKVLNPVKSNKLPFFDERKGIFYVPISKIYRYYVETIVPDGNNNIDYFLLLSDVKFDANCRICHTDSYGRCQIKVKGEFRDYISNESKERGNINIEYIETIANYDVFKVN